MRIKEFSNTINYIILKSVFTSFYLYNYTYNKKVLSNPKFVYTYHIRIHIKIFWFLKKKNDLGNNKSIIE